MTSQSVKFNGYSATKSALVSYCHVIDCPGSSRSGNILALLLVLAVSQPNMFRHSPGLLSALVPPCFTEKERAAGFEPTVGMNVLHVSNNLLPKIFTQRK
jgi:hypothetical protein